MRIDVGRFVECALEDWTWAGNTAPARKLGVPGYCMRVATEGVLIHEGANEPALLIKNRATNVAPAADELLAIDCLQLARYGLRAAGDPAMVSSTQAIDALLKTDTPNGAVWHRYNGDGYGEHPDGAPFDGWGIGRGWPLLTGERGHLALLAGGDGRPYLEAMCRMTGPGGQLPEQVWDSTTIPERGLYPGKPSGSAMPPVWAHAEYIKLALSIASGAPVDRPARTWARCRGRRPVLTYGLWQLGQRLQQLIAGQELRILVSERAIVHWGAEGWCGATGVQTEDWGPGHVARLPTSGLVGGRCIDFTLYWSARDQWQAGDFQVIIVAEHRT